MPNSDQQENIRTVYKELCNSYRAIDDFRTKLLGFLPLATGGLFLFFTNPEKLPSLTLFAPLGYFGATITLGLFCFEIYGIRKCTRLINVGKILEKDLGNLDGQFAKRLNSPLSEPFASGIIYPAVLAAWAFLANYPCSTFFVPLIVFSIGFLFSLCLIWWLNYKEEKS
jgi:hypothetical protein